jgi:hypothetical protein
MKPRHGGDSQCGTCFLWIRSQKCYIHRPSDKITKEMACVYYLQGPPMSPAAKPASIVTPEESGLVDRQVRCENCKWYDDHHCKFFEELNNLHGGLAGEFKLDTRVDPRGCCTAQEPPPERARRERRLSEEAL